MKTAYFDCASGIAGNMILGSLFSAGLNRQAWHRQIAKLRLPVKVVTHNVLRHGIRALQVEVRVLKPSGPRRLADVVKVIRQARLPTRIFERSVAVFERLARAEAKVHGTTRSRVHFHEVGADDCLADIVGSVLGLEMLGIEQVQASAVNLGNGRVTFSHGVFSVPAPAVAELLKGIPVYEPKYVTGELATPTGAAILRELSAGFGPMPAMSIASIGYGAGTRRTQEPNILRMYVGETADCGVLAAECEAPRVVVLETNIDDMNPELYGYVMERLFEAGALDVFLTPIQMKKNRPATLLSVIAQPDKTATLAGIILAETTSLGVRFQEVNRVCLDREVKQVRTRFGGISVKIGRLAGRVVTVAPEYEACQRAAKKYQVQLKMVYDEARRKVPMTKSQ
jgi:uncharacterized protein (TIGR00299 family) protein